jgi:hypothetical protein
MHTACLVVASILSGSSLYLYSYYAAHQNVKLNPLHSIIPVIAVFLGIGIFVYPALSVVLIGISIWIAYHPQYRIFGIHACICICFTASLLALDALRHTTKQSLLAHNTHTIQGLIIDHTEWLSHKKGCVVTLAITHIDHQPTTGIVKFFFYTPSPRKVGDFVYFSRFHLPITTEHKSSLTFYALRAQILGNYYGPSISMKKLPITTVYSAWIAYWHTWRTELYTTFKSTLPPTTFTYLSSLFLGNKQCDDYLGMRIHFTRWGLAHYLARSGLHISILMSLWLSLLTILPLCASLKAILLASILIMYDHLSWCSISFNRALWLWLFYIGGWLVRANATPFVGLCNLVILILLHNPWYAWCLDFQLSFFLTAVLMLLSYRREQSFLLSSCIAKKK